MKTGNIAFIKELETLLNNYKVCITTSSVEGCAFSLTCFDDMQILQDTKVCDKKLDKIKLSRSKNLANNYYYKIKVMTNLEKENEDEMDI
jgi:hypothetical protein